MHETPRLLAALAAGGPFALLRRDGRDSVELLTGPVQHVEHLSDIPLPDASSPSPLADARPDVLAVVPYRQVRERGFACVDDGTPLTVLRVDRYVELPVEEVRAALAGPPPSLEDGRFDLDDGTYGEIVQRGRRGELGGGEG